MDGVAYKRQVFFAHSFGGWKSEAGRSLAKTPFRVADCPLLMVSSCGGKKPALPSRASFVRALIPSKGPTS